MRPHAAVRLLGPAAALACLVVGGCAGPLESYNRGIAKLQLMQATELPDDQIDRVSGTYKGLQTLVAVQGDQPARCPHPRVGTLEIGDMTLEIAYTPNLIFTAPVMPDGSVRSVVGQSVLQGHVGNGYAVFTITTPVCSTRFDYRYVI